MTNKAGVVPRRVISFVSYTQAVIILLQSSEITSKTLYIGLSTATSLRTVTLNQIFSIPTKKKLS